VVRWQAGPDAFAITFDGRIDPSMISGRQTQLHRSSDSPT